MLGTKSKKFLIYSVIGLIGSQAGIVYAQESSTSKEVTPISTIEEKAKELVLDDHRKAVEYARDGDYASAYTHIQKAYEEYPDNPKVFTDYIAILSWMEKHDEAVAVYEQHQEFDFPDYAVEELIKSFREVGRYEDSIKLSEDFSSEHPENKDVTANLIYSLIQARRYQQAADQLISARKVHPDEPRFQSLQSLLYASEKQWTEFFNLIKEIKEKVRDYEKAGILSDLNEGFYFVYDEAISLARNNQFKEALDLLDKLEILEHKSQQLNMDRIVIYVWQGEFKKALEDYQHMDIQSEPPVYFLQEVARAHTVSGKEIELTGRHWTYVAPYVQAIEEQEYQKATQLAFIRSRMEEGDNDQALEMIDEVLQEDPKQQEALFLKAEIYDAAGEYWKAVKVYQQIEKIYPDNAAALNLKLRSLMDLGATSLVLEESEKYPDIVDPVVAERARTNVPMHQIRWEEPKPALRKIDMLEEEYSGAFSEDQKDEKVSENYQRIQWDRFLALRQEDKMSEIIEEYESYLKKGSEIPPWVHRAAADAYLYMQMPEEALEIYNELLKEDRSFDLQMSAYYTLVELGRYKEAQEVLDQLDKETPSKVIHRGILQDNWQKADIAFNKAWVLMYQDRLKEAEQYIQDNKEIAPFNTHLRTAEAHNHFYRGWKRQALEDFKIIRTLDDRLISSHIGYARALNANMEKEQAREEVDKILEKKPTNKHAQRLKREFDVEEMSMVTFSGNYTTESPGVDEFILFLRGDQPINFHHNLFVEVVRRETTQEGSNDVARKIRLGDEWQINNNWRLVGALTGDYEKMDDLGFLGEIRYQPNDYWTFDFGYESDTLDIDSRSRKSGVEADLYTLSATYRASELFDTTFGVSYKDFTDNNEYLNYFWRTDTALTTSAYWKTRLGTEFSYETFSDQDVDYFSPEEVYSFYLVPMVEHTWFRRYERAWVDRMYLGIGKKWQKSFGSSGVGYIRYEQDHKFSDTKSWLIGATYSMNEYDDENVDSLDIFTTIRFKF